MSTILEELGQRVKEGDRVKAVELTRSALVEGIDFQEVMKNGLIRGMTAIGDLFGKGEVYVPEVIMSARAMKESMELILPILSESKFDYIAKCVIGTVKDDMHEIGKKIVAAVFLVLGLKLRIWALM